MSKKTATLDRLSTVLLVVFMASFFGMLPLYALGFIGATLVSFCISVASMVALIIVGFGGGSGDGGGAVIGGTDGGSSGDC